MHDRHKPFTVSIRKAGQRDNAPRSARYMHSRSVTYTGQAVMMRHMNFKKKGGTSCSGQLHISNIKRRCS